MTSWKLGRITIVYANYVRIVVHILGIDHERTHFGKDILGAVRRCFRRWRRLRLRLEHNCLANLAADADKAVGNLLLRPLEYMRFHRSPRLDFLTLL